MTHIILHIKATTVFYSLLDPIICILLAGLIRHQIRIIAPYSFLREESGKGGADLYSLISSDRMCASALKMHWGVQT